MPDRSNFSNYLAIRTAFNKARELYDLGEIDILEYRKLLSGLFEEIKEIDKELKENEITDLLEKMINTETKF